MGYEDEPSNRASHYDIIRHPGVAAFLERCQYARAPSDQEANELRAGFVPVPPAAGPLPTTVLAVDGSLHEARIHTNVLPSTAIGFVKVSAFYLDLTQLAMVRLRGSELVDPFAMAALQDTATSYVLPLPAANVRFAGAPSVRDGFRAALDELLAGEGCRLLRHDPTSSLRHTLFELLREPRQDVITLKNCPSCDGVNVPVRNTIALQRCPHCTSPVYVSDDLRIWEAITEEGSAGEALGRVMNVVEHIAAASFVRFLEAHGGLERVANLAVLLDGPLAIMGNPARLHRRLMAFFHDVNERLDARSLPRLLVVGLQKKGMLAEHLDVVARFLAKETVRPVDDEYRNRYVVAGALDATSSFGHGKDTHYGQDFLLKTKSGGQFVLALPYPWRSKGEAQTLVGRPFREFKGEPEWYRDDLARACALVSSLETSLYPNALIPISLAHQFTAISLLPGGRALEVMAERALARR